MEIEVFRKNVLKTLPTKAVKLGMRVASKSTSRTVTAQGVIALKRDVGNVMHALGQYILGMQMSAEMKQAAFTAMGDVGADLILLCKVLKVKTPTATKKVKLTGTRTAALLQLDMLTNDMLDLVASGVFRGPRMTTVKKDVVMPTKGGIKELRDVEVVDTEAEAAAEEERAGSMRSLLSSAVDLYWRLCFNIFNQAPSTLFAAKAERLSTEYPDIEFIGLEKAKGAA